MVTGDNVENVDILVVGGGAAGLTASLLAAQADFTVMCVDRADLSAPDDDLRTAAVLEPTAATLERVGVWRALTAGPTPRATALATMRIVDDGEGAARRRATADFDALDIDRSVFGWNVANGDLRSALIDRARSTPNLNLVASTEIEHITFREDAARATLGGGRRLAASLVVGADGRDSFIRTRLGIKARRFAYNQQALVFHVAHDRPHGGVSTEIYRRGGPFTLVPHYGTDETPHRSAVVWMEANREAASLLALSDDAFETAVNERSLGVLGPLAVISERRAWPIVSLLADRFYGRRAALIAEAAHVAPPIGAQGLNMSLRDAEVLVDAMIAARSRREDIGSTKLLERFSRERWPAVAARVGATAALDMAAIGDFRPIRDARRIGLRLIHGSPAVRRRLMRAGMDDGFLKNVFNR